MYGSVASVDEYDRAIAEWLANGRQLQKVSSNYSIAEVAAKFWKHVQEYYVKPDGTPTSKRTSFQSAMGPLVRLFGRMQANDFGPLSLKTVRNEMISKRWCRKHVND